MVAPSLFIFVALPSEAKPLIEHWRLRKLIDSHPFKIYSNSLCVLVVGGVGKLAMAGAVAYTMAVFRTVNSPVLLNLGIAGHKSHNLGSMLLAHKIIDTDNLKSYYPQCLPDSANIKSAVLKTVNKPELNYTDDYLYDMEAVGFYEMAVKFSSCELIHCLKVVSDNQLSGLENIDECKVESWIRYNLPACLNLIERLIQLRAALYLSNQADLYELTAAKFHITASNAIKLKALIQRWQVLGGNQSIFDRHLQTKNLKEFLLAMETEIGTIELYL